MASSDRAGSAWLLSQVEVEGVRTDCRIADGRIVELGPDLSGRDGETRVDAGGGALIPGLAEHHIHLWALAAARSSVDLAGAPDVEQLRGVTGSGWLRVIGAGRELRRQDLDAVLPTRPVRVQHRSGALWTLNSAAIELLGGGLDAAERSTGQLWRADTRLRRLLADAGAAARPDLAAVGRELAARGITHVTDATPDLAPESISALDGALPQRVLSLAAAGTGAVKIVLADHELPDLDRLVEQVRAAHDAGRPVALHAVTAVTLVLACAALEGAGALPRDRIEHAAVCDDPIAERLAELGVTVVTQPTLWTRFGAQYRRDSPPRERPLLWRYGTLLSLGVRVAVSSDAPYGDPDPWRTVRAAVGRELQDGTIGGPQERVTPQTALSSLLADPADPAGPPRTVSVGAVADLALLRVPLQDALDTAARSGASAVRATFIAGQTIVTQSSDPIAHGSIG
jgi:predicted amidohydrolase YtcJ